MKLILESEIDFSHIKHQLIRNLLQRILVKDPEKRISITDILKHPWITQCGNEEILINEVDEKKGFGNIRRLMMTKANG